MLNQTQGKRRPPSALDQTRVSRREFVNTARRRSVNHNCVFVILQLSATSSWDFPVTAAQRLTEGNIFGFGQSRKWPKLPVTTSAEAEGDQNRIIQV